MHVTIKSPQVFLALMGNDYNIHLVDMTMFIIETLQHNDIEPVVTSAYRYGDPGVHGLGRGIDFRTWDMTPIFIKKICQEVHKRWQYDPNRPEKDCLIYHDVGRGPHLHLQAHPNTRRLKT